MAWASSPTGSADPRTTLSRRRRLADALVAARRRVLRRRRLLAALLVGVAVAAALRTLAPPPPASAPVLVAARDLPAGHVLAGGDVTTVRVAPGAVPDGVVDEPSGQLLAAPLRRGEAVTDVRLVGPGLARAQPPGTTVVPVRLTDAGQAALLRPGDRIDLIATDPGSGTARPLAAGATVMALPGAQQAADGALPGRLVVVALADGDVYAVTAATAASYVTYTWRRR